jgi:hypothetical protein
LHYLPYAKQKRNNFYVIFVENFIFCNFQPIMKHLISAQVARKIIAVCTGLGIALAVLGSELYAALTTQRASLFILFGTTILSATHLRYPRALAAPLFFYAILSAVFLVAGSISSAISPWGIWPIFSLLMMALLGGLILLNLSTLHTKDKDTLLDTLIYFSIIYFAVIFIYCLKTGVALSPGYKFRYFANEFSEVGLNRIINGMAFFGAVGMLGYFNTNYGVLKRLGCALLPLFVIYFSFSSGARQGLITILLFATTLMAITWIRNFRKKINERLKLISLNIKRASALIPALLLAYYLAPYLINADIHSWYMDRFIASVDSGGSSGDMLRLGAAEAAISYGFSNGGMGIGLGGFDKLHGLEAHNGYLGFFAEVGLYFSLICAASLTVYLLYCYRVLHKMHGSMEKITMAYIPAHFFFVINVKDILLDPFTWAILGLAGGVGIKMLPDNIATKHIKKN